MKILNLDKIVDDDKCVTIDGVDYMIPSDVNLDIMLKLVKSGQEVEENPSNPEVLDNAVETIFEVFKIKNENIITYEEFKKKIGIKQYTALMQFIMGGFEEAEKKPADTKELKEKQKE